jgi:predicted SnoaL-like aldol condensation-catalyzing enzyme
LPAQPIKDAAVEFLRLVASGRIREAFGRHIGPGFRHHNPYFAGDGPSLMAGMEADAVQHPDKILEVRLALEEGDHVAVHSRVRRQPDDPGFALVRIFRFEGPLIVEAWDIGQAVPPDTPNEHGMF